MCKPAEISERKCLTETLIMKSPRAGRCPIQGGARCQTPVNRSILKKWACSSNKRVVNLLWPRTIASKDKYHYSTNNKTWCLTSSTFLKVSWVMWAHCQRNMLAILFHNVPWRSKMRFWNLKRSRWRAAKLISKALKVISNRPVRMLTKMQKAKELRRKEQAKEGNTQTTITNPQKRNTFK